MTQHLVRRLRRERGLTQSELGVRAGVSPTTVSLIERQDDYNPAPRVKRRLAEALGVSISTLWPTVEAEAVA